MCLSFTAELAGGYMFMGDLDPALDGALRLTSNGEEPFATGFYTTDDGETGTFEFYVN